MVFPVSVHPLFLAASEMALKSLDFLTAAKKAAAEGRQEDARACLKGIAVLATTDLASALQEMRPNLTWAAPDIITTNPTVGRRYHPSAHDAILSLWLQIHVMVPCCPWDWAVTPELLESLGFDAGLLRIHLVREQDKLLHEARPAEQTLTIPPESECRIQVDVEEERVCLDGIQVPLNFREDKQRDAVFYLAVLVLKYPNWCSDETAQRENRFLAGVRLDRVRNKLPEKLKAFIKTTKGLGARLTPEAWKM